MNTKMNPSNGATSAMLTGRYIAHVEDQPALWQRRFENIGDAVQACHDTLVLQGTSNGGGDGLVVDALAQKVVCVFEGGVDDANGEFKLTVGQPDTRDLHDRMVDAVLAHECKNGSEPLPFIWETCS